MRFSLAAGKPPLKPALVALAVVACLLAPALPARALDETPRTADELKAAITRVLEEEQVPSAAVALVSGDTLSLTAGFGAGPDGPATPASLYRLGSASELVVALVAQRLAERGVVDLEQPLRALAPGVTFESTFEAAHPLRLSHLLEHTSGLEELLPRESVSVAPASALEPVGALAALHRRVLRWAPGSRFAFSSANATLAALALEQAARTPFDELARREVFEPLGLMGTSYALAEAQRGQPLGAHRGSELADARPLHWPARGLLSSARDLGLLLRVLTARGAPGQEPYLRPESIDRLARGRTLPVADRLYGPAPATAAVFDDGFWAQARRGQTQGSLSELRWVPREQRGYVLLVGDGHGDAARARIGLLLRRFLLKDLRPPEPSPRAAVPREELAGRAGFWVRISPSDHLVEPLDRLLGNVEVLVDDHPDGAADLRLRVGFHAARSLLPLGGEVFRFDGEPQPTVAFESPAAGPARLWLRGDLYEKRTVLQALWMRVRFALTVLTLLGLASALAFAGVWVPRALFRSLGETADLRLRTLPALSALVGLLLWLVSAASTQDPGAFNLTSALYWLLPLLWTALSLSTLLVALRAVPQRAGLSRRLVWMHAFFVAVLSCGLAGWLAWNGLLGIRPWAL